MSMVTYLKSNIPDFLGEVDPTTKTNNLLEFLDASGEYLEDTREAINHFKNFFDSYNGTYYNIINALADYGYTMPKRFPEQDVRRFLRDHVEIIKRIGTFEELILIFRLIGIEVEIMEAWLLDPLSTRKGYIRNTDGTKTKTQFTSDIYHRFLYGKSVITDDGVKFEGYTYIDVNKSEKLTYYIYGENYNVPIYKKDTVAKTPYLTIRLLSDITIIDEDDASTVNLDIGTYIDESGKSYYYTTNEKYTLITELIEFFLVKEMRPTTVKITNISTSHILSDSFEVAADDVLEMEDFDSVGAVHPHPMYDKVSMGDEFTIDNESTVEPTDPDGTYLNVADSIKTITTYPISPVIGDPIIIGSSETPFISSSSTIGALTLSDQTTFTVQETYNWDAMTSTFNYYLDSGVYLVVRAMTTLSFINTTSAIITVYGKETSDNVVRTVSVGETVTMSVGEYRYYRLAGSGVVSVTIVASAFNE